ncbi:ADP-ribose diphosphatase [Saliniradius amylolyticus]|uniref:ADP-ribose pyrophosphatase n=1 Tax=Saliniradius amylolyticus TaxID=2183582 RepID=A0A2S2E0F2_9ALTE|nr:ADP-ribose diphosphatase [Saliniradius amylolyticus]AWL11079.1 ADP-ribose diphosphatase [Saliniradius amylolyticus]
MTFRSRFSADDVTIINKETPYQGFFRMLTYTLKHRLFNGGWSEPIQREVFERGSAVAVLPYDPVRKEVALIEQFRPGAMATCDTPWLLECVAGEIESGESVEEVAYREAEEEAGVKLKRLWPMLSYLSSPGGTSERLHVYLGECELGNAGGVHGLDSEHEDIYVHRFPEEEALSLLAEGKIDNASTVIALQWLALNQKHVHERWCE